MGFTNQERINYNSKYLQAAVQDGVPSKQWYESLFPAYTYAEPESILIEFHRVVALTASTPTEASGNVTNYLSGVVENLFEDADAIRLTALPASNGFQYAAYETYNDFSSARLKNWVQPQRVPKSNGQPSQGYSMKLYEGDPSAGGTEVTTTQGQTGTGNNASVGWIFNYDGGVLLLSEDFKATITDPYVKGFRYIGKTASSFVTSSFFSGTGGGEDDHHDFTAGEDVIARDAVFIDTNGNVLKSNPVVISGAFSVGFTLSASLSGNTVQVDTRQGKILQGFSGLVTGQRYFLSASHGQITTNPGYPDQGYLIYQIGIARSETQLMLDPKILVEL